MSEVSLTVATSAEMRALGRSLATVLRAGDLVIVSGGLGAGKTTLTQGIGDGLGGRGPITSPTFVPGGGPPRVTSATAAVTDEPRPALVHADAYRLGSALELDDLDLDTDTAASVTVVEWGEGLAEGLSTDRLEITITPGPANSTVTSGNGVGDPDDPTGDVPRTVRISAVGRRWEGVKLPLANLADRL